ncbi:MAG: hypothetical protein KZQ75_08015 [Candidatus Thiodiazotropha sp. (ex Myrtea spinifera)]|nr:hypothetical protein [Candidatus Thiodiazotropha sp. (ex Myrtea spinifera)]
MSQLIKDACLEVARTNMWDNRPVDASPIIDYQNEMAEVSIEALNHFEELGATEQDIADAIHYVAQVYALPPIKNNVQWFRDTLFTILEPAFPNGGVADEAERFARKLIQGIKEQIS